MKQEFNVIKGPHSNQKQKTTISSWMEEQTNKNNTKKIAVIKNPCIGISGILCGNPVFLDYNKSPKLTQNKNNNGTTNK